MSMYVPMSRAHQSRTIKPRYARTQATPQAVRLDPKWDGSRDIFPGSVLSRKDKGVVTLCDDKKAPAGLCGNFVAPVFGIDEVRGGAGDWDMSMWVPGGDSIFAIYAPAFDAKADWAGACALLDEGKAVYLKSSADGLLTTEAEPSTATELSICRLVGMEGSKVILVAGLL